jgi:hypothetical protein
MIATVHVLDHHSELNVRNIPHVTHLELDRHTLVLACTSATHRIAWTAIARLDLENDPPTTTHTKDPTTW